MLKSYFKTAIRNLYKNKLYSFINIVGLGMAMAICVVGYVNYQFSRSFDAFHENADDIYLVSSSTLENEERLDWSYIPMPLLPTIKQEIPGIVYTSRVSLLGCNVSYGDKVFNERVYLVDDDFFAMFTFPDLNGMKKNLVNKNSLFITRRIAIKYFGNEDPVGKHLTVNYNNQDIDFYVQDVLKNAPANSNLPIAILIPMENLEQMTEFDLGQ